MSEQSFLAFLCGPAQYPLWRILTVPTRQEKAWQHNEKYTALRQVRKEIKRNRKAKPARNRLWQLDETDELDDEHYQGVERVMPRGERERRRTLWNTALTRLDGATEEAGEPAAVAGSQVLRGLVTEVSTSLCRVNAGAQTWLCSLRGGLSAEDTGYTNVVAVGDQVLVTPDGAGSGVVNAVLPRHSALVRPDVFHSHLQQVIVANADQLLVVASWRNPALWPELVDRYLITAERNRLVPILCVNKIDLAEDRAACEEAMRPYVHLGYRVLFTSAVRTEGIDELRQVLRGRMTVLAGLSGVGKSSLLAAVQPGLQLRTAEISARRHEGRHTTTQVSLLTLQMGGLVVDTPGIREFGLSGLRKADLAGFYADISALHGACQFANCSHTHEPGCAVQDAVHRGHVPATRYENYKKIYDTLPD